MIPLYDDPAVVTDKINALIGKRTVTDDIAQADDGVNALRASAPDHPREGLQVSVNVRNHSDTHVDNVRSIVRDSQMPVHPGVEVTVLDSVALESGEQGRGNDHARERARLYHCLILRIFCSKGLNR